MAERRNQTSRFTKSQLEQWLLSYRDGELVAFDKLYDNTAGIVFASLVRLVKNEEVPDLVQETFLRIHKHIRSYRRDGNALSWILTIAQNVAFDHLAAGKRRVELEKNLKHQPEESASGSSTLPDELDGILEELLPEDRALVIERFHAGKTFAQMAALRDISEATLRQRLSRVIRSIRKIVQT